MTDEDWKDYARRVQEYDRAMERYLRDVDVHVRYGERSPYGRLGRLSARPTRPIPPARLGTGAFVKPHGAGRKVRNAQELRTAFCAWRQKPRSGRGQGDFAEWLGLTDDRQVRRYCRDYNLPWRELLRTGCE
jgi:hypothetical protein